MVVPSEIYIRDLEKFKKKFPFPFKSENEKDDFLLTYKKNIEEIHCFCDSEFDYFRSDTLNIKSTFEGIYRLILIVIESKLRDDDETAIHYFNELMEIYKKENGTSSSSENKSSRNGKMSFDAFQSSDVKDFFRIRPLALDQGKINCLTKEDMFHIKYQERRKCKNYRFSISGIPALYLGDTIELCEKEIFYDKDVNQYYVSHFRNQDSFKVITIDFPESVIWGLRADNYIPSALRFFAYLPFSVACLFRTAPPHNHSFNPEYIIPQLLMSFLKKNTEVDGVRFPSTKFPYNEKIKPSFNYAFPVKEPDEDGFCKNLKRIFDWTDPILSEIDYGKMKTALSDSAGKIVMSDSMIKIREAYKRSL
jgi:hypothetical protein